MWVTSALDIAYPVPSLAPGWWYGAQVFCERMFEETCLEESGMWLLGNPVKAIIPALPGPFSLKAQEPQVLGGACA